MLPVVDARAALLADIADDPLWQVVVGDGYSLIGFPGAGHREVMRRRSQVHSLWLNLGYRVGDVAFDSDRLRERHWGTHTLIYLPPGAEFTHTCLQAAAMVEVRLTEPTLARLTGEDWSGGRLGEARPVDGTGLATLEKALYECLYGDSRLQPLAVENVLVEFLARAAAALRAGSAHRSPVSARRAPPSRVARAAELVAASPEARLSLDELASHAGLSPFHFAKSFRAATGMPPHRYVLAQRVSRARVLLATTDAPLTDIALDTGFASQSHFTDVFRRQMGVTPRRYREALARVVVPRAARPGAGLSGSAPR